MNTVAFFKRTMAAAAVVFVLVACSKDETEAPAPRAVPSGPYTILIESQYSRSLLSSDEHGRFGLWENGDKVGTVITASGSTFSGSADVVPGSPVSFNVYHEGGFAGGEVVRAYYPYNQATTGLDNVAFEIPAQQNQTADGFDFEAMPMVSTRLDVNVPVADPNIPIGELRFANLASVAEFRIFSSSSQYEGEVVSSVSFESNEALAGAFSADISQMDPYEPTSLVISGYSGKTVTTSVEPAIGIGSDLSSSSSVFMVVAPGTYSGTVVVTTDKAIYRFSLKSSQPFRRAVVRGLGVDLATCGDRTSTEVFTSITVTKTIPQILASSGVPSPENGAIYDVLTMDDVITLEADYGKYYDTGNSWRIYPPVGSTKGNGNLKIKAAYGYELQSVTLTYTINAGTSGGSSVKPSFDGPASKVAKALSGNLAMFYVTGKAGHIRITQVSVTYIQTNATPNYAYLGCYEIPAVESKCCISDDETFDDDGSNRSRWYEFDTPDNNRKIITHTFLNGGKRYRNFTSMMDKDKRCPLWVAYPLHGVTYKDNNIGREGSFSESSSYDPAIPSSWQSSGSTSDYNSGNGYSRGHLCASEDRQVTLASNYQTFYYTNQAPQWQNSFNNGVWSSLESAVQTKAKTLTQRDTLYVVSGTLYDPFNSGSSNDAGTVARPSHFYKLLMLCSFDSSGNMTSANGTAYLYTNEAHKGSNYGDSAFRSSIDDIETLAGFDFFAGVPASLQEDAESSFHSIL